MSALADDLAKIVTPRIKTARIVTLDIERLPGRAKHQHRGLTIEGDFWDLNSWKHTIGYRLPVESVLEWPRTICVAWRWYGQKRTEFASEWGDGAEGMLRRVWEVFDQADVAYGHNIARFDARKLNTEWRDLGFPPPTPVKFVDTLTECRRVFGDESNTLAALTQRLGIDTKTDKYDVAVARAAVAGDVKAQRRLERYNRGDIAASEALVDRLRGWLPTHPHMGELDEHGTLTCPQCGSDDLKRNGWHQAVVQEFARYQCGNCGGHVRSNLVRRVANTRGIR